MTEALVLLGATGIVILVLGTPPLQRDRMSRRLDPHISGLGGRPSRLIDRSYPHEPRVGSWLHRHLSRGENGSDLNARLDRADKSMSPAAFRIEQLLWGLATCGLGVGITLTTSATRGMDLRAVPVLTMLTFSLGFLARDRWLTAEIERRQARLRDELPTAIDLVTLSIMAGESVPAACHRVAVTLGSGIGAEFGRVLADTRAGAPVVEALEAMSHRVPVPGVARFVDAVTMAIERGSPLADTLRAQADDGRESRRRHLIELGGRREVLMLVPVVFLIMPVVVVFALLPGLVSLELLVP